MARSVSGCPSTVKGNPKILMTFKTASPKASSGPAP